jgi:thiamine-phosphate pyrophosphorylase
MFGEMEDYLLLPQRPIRGLYGMADSSWGDPLAQYRMLAEEDVSVVQFRCKNWEDSRLLEVVSAAGSEGPLRIVNDRIPVAQATGCWVHLGQEDGADPPLPFGRSTHSLQDLAQIGSATYIGFGPVFASTTKAGVRSPRGLELLAEVVRQSPVPVVAIGGIDRSNIDAVRRTGVAAWAVIGAIWGAADPRAAIRALR